MDAATSPSYSDTHAATSLRPHFRISPFGRRSPSIVGDTGRMENILSEDWLKSAVMLLVRLVESAGALIIFVGTVIAFARFIHAALVHRHDPHHFVSVRLGLGRYLALGLEFQLASDVLKTAVSPTLTEIGQLAAIAAIRTALNYFLAKEIKQEQALLEQREGQTPSRDGVSRP